MQSSGPPVLPPTSTNLAHVPPSFPAKPTARSIWCGDDGLSMHGVWPPRHRGYRRVRREPCITTAVLTGPDPCRYRTPKHRLRDREIRPGARERKRARRDRERRGERSSPAIASWHAGDGRKPRGKVAFECASWGQAKPKHRTRRPHPVQAGAADVAGARRPHLICGAGPYLLARRVPLGEASVEHRRSTAGHCCTV